MERREAEETMDASGRRGRLSIRSTPGMSQKPIGTSTPKPAVRGARTRYRDASRSRPEHDAPAGFDLLRSVAGYPTRTETSRRVETPASGFSPGFRARTKSTIRL